MTTSLYILYLSTVMSCRMMFVRGESTDMNGDLKSRMDFLQNVLIRHQTTIDQLKSENDKQRETNENLQSEIESLRKLCHRPHIRTNVTDKTVRGAAYGPAAFFAVKSHSETAIADHTIVFDTDIVNKGNAYNSHTGTFTAPETGLYFFSWTIHSDFHSYLSTRLMVDGKQMNVIFSDSQEVHDYHSSTGVVILELYASQVVYIKSHPTYGQVGSLYSSSIGRSTFSGYLIF